MGDDGTAQQFAQGKGRARLHRLGSPFSKLSSMTAAQGSQSFWRPLREGHAIGRINKMNELYQRLGVTLSATAEEIKMAYRKLAKQLHPDLHPNDPHAEAKFKAVNEAYEILSDPDKRASYDTSQRPSQGERKGNKPGSKRQTPRPPSGRPMDFAQVSGGFAQFFGFDPDTGLITDETKISGENREKNPLDMSDMFEKFMGFR